MVCILFMLVFRKPVQQDLGTLGGCLCADVFVSVGGFCFVFHAPAWPLAEGMIGPVPIVFFKDADAVGQIFFSARCPAYGAKFTDKNMGMVPMYRANTGLG